MLKTMTSSTSCPDESSQQVDLSIVVPCFNEVDSIPALECGLRPVVALLVRSCSLELVFVDDGSSDGTSEAIRTSLGSSAGVPCRVEKHPTNRGLGAALRTGFEVARGEVIVTTDCDGTYRFAEIPCLLSYLTPDVDVVTASPYHPLAGVDNVPFYRLLLSRGSSLIYRLLVSGGVHTYTSLFRAYRRHVIEAIPFGSDGFLAGTEILVKALLKGYRVVECPMVLHARQRGTSKAKLARTMMAHLEFQGRVLRHRLGITPMV